jgi:hypothetical protein
MMNDRFLGLVQGNTGDKYLGVIVGTVEHFGLLVVYQNKKQ